MLFLVIATAKSGPSSAKTDDFSPAKTYFAIFARTKVVSKMVSKIDSWAKLRVTHSGLKDNMFIAMVTSMATRVPHGLTLNRPICAVWVQFLFRR